MSTDSARAVLIIKPEAFLTSGADIVSVADSRGNQLSNFGRNGSFGQVMVSTREQPCQASASEKTAVIGMFSEVANRPYGNVRFPELDRAPGRLVLRCEWSSSQKSTRCQAGNVIGERGDLRIGQSLHRRGHVAVDVAPCTRAEALELRGKVFDVLAGDARDAVLAGQGGAAVTLHTVPLLCQRRAGGARGVRRPMRRRPRFQPAVIGGEVAQVVV